MNSINIIDTLSLLNKDCSFIHILYLQIFRLTKSTRNKYKLSVNNIVVLNGAYVYHKYIGSSFSLSSLYKLLGYYNRNRLRYYLDNLCLLGYLIQSDIINGNKFYKITLAGLQVIEYFNSTYQQQLSKFLQDHKIEL